jgi:HEPN domain-containing protein
LSEINVVSKRLTQERGPAFYGDEKAFAPLSFLYGEEDAKRAITDAEKILNPCKRFFNEWKG